MSKLQNNHNVSSLIMDGKHMIISGHDGCAKLSTGKQQYYLDQFDTKNIIESLFDTLRDIQKENLIRQLTERRNSN